MSEEENAFNMFVRPHSSVLKGSSRFWDEGFLFLFLLFSNIQNLKETAYILKLPLVMSLNCIVGNVGTRKNNGVG